MTVFSKSVRLFLENGTVTGIKFGEIVNNTIQAISCPRARVNELTQYPESKRPGVYFLLGLDEETGDPKVYIGEGENVYARLQHHIANKDFWTEVILFISKDENLTKSHVKYLESRLIQTAHTTKRYNVENSNQSQPASLPRADRDAMEEFLSYLRLLLGVLGHKLLEDLTVVSKHLDSKDFNTVEDPASEYYSSSVVAKNELYLSIATIKAKAIQTDEGIVVLKGSEASREHTKSLSFGYRELRDKLINNNILVISLDKYLFNEDYLFNSSSQAAAIIVGYSINGPAAWKNSEGKTLKEMEWEKIPLDTFR